MRNFKTILILGLLCIFATNSQASHIIDAEISYAEISPGIYEINLDFYRDCSGITAPTTVNVTLESAFCGINQAIVLTQTGTTEVSSICPAQLANTTCNGGTLPGVQRISYIGTASITSLCPDFKLSFTTCCRNPSITNLVAPSSANLYTEVNFDTRGYSNSSPVFNSTATLYACNFSQLEYDFGGIDPDGDDLVYTITNPLDDAVTGVPYVTPYSNALPFAVDTNGFQFDSLTGVATFTPIQNQVANLGILVEEYRNGVKIADSRREIQVIVTSCSNSFPEFSELINISGAAQVDSFELDACPGDSVMFSVLISDPNLTDTLAINTNVQNEFPQATESLTVFAPSATLYSFVWVPGVSDTGPSFVSITATDNACPIAGVRSILVKINVNQRTSAGQDKTYCPGGFAQRIDVVGGSNFSWNPTNGIINATPDSSTVWFAPSTTTQYIVTSDLSIGCLNDDTVVINVVPSFTYSLSGDTSFCKNDNAQLYVDVDNSSAPYEYNWSPSAGLSSTTVHNPFASPALSTMYTVSITANNGCVKEDSIFVGITGTGPEVSLGLSNNNVCIGDTVHLNADFNSFSCGLSIDSCQNPNTTATIGNSTAILVGTPFMGSSEDARTQILYRASELTAAGLSKGMINSFTFTVASKASSAAYQNLSIKMGCTNDDQLNSVDGFVSGLETVMGPVNYTTAFAFNTFTLDNMFNWDGVSNLIVEICYDNPNGAPAGGIDDLLMNSSSYVSVLRAFTNFSSGCALSVVSSAFVIPNTEFNFCPVNTVAPSFYWTPQTGLSDPNSLNPYTVVSSDVTYTITVQDSLCSGSAYKTISVDSSFYINASVDTSIVMGDTVQLMVTTIGNPPGTALSCGDTGTACIDTVASWDLNLDTILVSEGTPYEGFWHDGRVQYIVRAEELLALGMGPSSISSLAFNVITKQSTIPYNGFTIKIGCTDKSSLSGTTFDTTSLTTVFGPITYTTTLGWNYHNFDHSIDWDGISNLMVEICHDNSAFTNRDFVQGTLDTVNSVFYDFIDGSIGCFINTPTLSSSKPAMRFGACLSPPGQTLISWSPSTGLSNPTIVNPLANPTQSTTYTVTATFLNGCVQVDTVRVDVLAGGCPTVTELMTDKIKPTSARLSWTPVLGADHYVIRGRRAGSIIWKFIIVPGGSPNFRTVSGLANNTNYEWQIITSCDPSETNLSNWSVLSAFTTGCFAPDSVWTSNITATSATFNWTKVTGVDGYEVRGRLQGGPWIVLPVGAANTSKNVFGLNPSTNYEWKIKAICNQAGNVSSANTAVEAFTTAAIRQGDLELSNVDSYLKVYPNPFMDMARVEFNNPDGKRTRVYVKDISGRILRQQDVGTDAFYLHRSGLSAGIYILEVHTSSIQRKRIILE